METSPVGCALRTIFFPLQTRLKKDGGCPPATIFPYISLPLADQRPNFQPVKPRGEDWISATVFPPLKP